MASQKATLDNLQQAIDKILSDYSDEVKDNLDEITKAVIKKGTQTIKTESLSAFPDSKKHKKRYGQTWTSSVESGRLSTQGAIYNTQAGLPHLLENGHALVAGGRQVGSVAGRKHIAPVADELCELYEREVVRKL